MDILKETYLVKVKKSDRDFGKYLLRILFVRLDSKLSSLFWNRETLELTGEFEDIEEELHELNLFRLSKRLCQEIVMKVQVRNGVSYGLHIGFPEQAIFTLDHVQYYTAQTARALDFGSQDRVALNLFLPELLYLKENMDILWDRYQEEKEAERRKAEKENEKEQGQSEKDKESMDALQDARKDRERKILRSRKPADKDALQEAKPVRETKQEINRRLSSPKPSPEPPATEE